MKVGLVSPAALASMLIAISSPCFAQKAAATPAAPARTSAQKTASTPAPPTRTGALKTSSPAVRPVQTGAAPFLFRTVPGWGAVPSELSIGPTHGGIAVDRAGNVYVASDNKAGIFVFAREGRLLRTMAPEFAGTHALLIHNENGTEYLYGVHLRRTRAFKMTLDGTPVMILPFPRKAGVYGPRGEGYLPSAIAVALDQSIFVADGYGSNLIHKYSPQGEYLRSFGGKGREEGKFLACIGLAIDSRGKKPLLLACDRDNRRLQYFDLDGNFVRVAVENLGRPSSLSFFGQCLAIAENEGRVTLLGKDNAVAASLGENPDQKEWGDFKLPRASWREGIFVAPHSLCWDPVTGSLYVQEWSMEGRVTKLEPVR
ncbi:MAG: hypothetical protein QOE70_928 [Chthoniobacter sp.]|jgi:hypothetical protein|nr:hypothetical protein [Chthoniobacter sp.]